MSDVVCEHSRLLTCLDFHFPRCTANSIFERTDSADMFDGNDKIVHSTHLFSCRREKKGISPLLQFVPVLATVIEPACSFLTARMIVCLFARGCFIEDGNETQFKRWPPIMEAGHRTRPECREVIRLAGRKSSFLFERDLSDKRHRCETNPERMRFRSTTPF